MATRDFFELKIKKTSTGQIVRSFRKNFKLTQSELSEMTGIAETNLSAIENDRVEIGVKRAVLIATAIGIDPSQLLFPNGVEDTFPKEIRNVQRASAKVMKKKVGPWISKDVLGVGSQQDTDCRYIVDTASA